MQNAHTRILGGKPIYWSHVLGLDHSCLGLSVAFGALSPPNPRVLAHGESVTFLSCPFVRCSFVRPSVRPVILYHGSLSHERLEQF